MHLLPRFSATVDESDERSEEIDRIPGPIWLQVKEEKEEETRTKKDNKPPLSIEMSKTRELEGPENYTTCKKTHSDGHDLKNMWIHI